MERGFGVRLSANVDSYVAAMARARAATGALTKESVDNFGKVGAQLQRVGASMTRAVTVPILGAAAGAVKLSADFDAAFAKMVGLAGVAANEVDGLKESVLDLAGETGRAPAELADALYFASSAGLSTAQAMDAVEEAARASAAGMGKTSDVVGLVASAIAAYGDESIDAARATDILTAAVRAGRADPEELAGTLGRVLPIAAQLGVTFEEVGGATAFLSNIFGDTNRTVTALQGFLVKLVSPSQQGRDALKEMGTSAAELQAAIDSRGLLGALDLLRAKGFAGNQEALRHLFDDIEGYQAALALLNDRSGQLNDTIDETTNSVGAADEAFNAMSETTSFQFQQAWAKTQAALIEAGKAIAPVVAGVAGALADLLGIFNRLPGPVKVIVLGFLAFAASVGPVVYVIGTLVRNIMIVRAAIVALTSLMTTSPLAGFAIAAAAVGTALALVTSSSDESADAIARLRDIMKDATGPVDAFSKFLLEQAEGMPIFARAMADADITIADLAAAAAEGDIPLLLLTSRIEQAALAAGASLPEMTQIWTLLKGLPGRAAEAALQLGDLAFVTGETGKSAYEAERALRPLGESFEYVERVVGDHTTAIEQANRAAEAQKELIEEQTKALQRHIDALEDDLAAQIALVDFARGAADSQFALADATDSYSRHLEDLPAKIKQIGESEASVAEKQRQINALYRDSAELAAAMADANVQAMDDAAGGTLTATQKLDAWNDTMMLAAMQASGPGRAEILKFIATANDIPADKATYIAALIDQGRFDEAQTLLDEVSASRDATIKADADQASLDAAEADLDAAAADRDAQIIARAETSGANTSFNTMVANWRRLSVGIPIYLGGTGSRGVYASASGRYVDRPIVSMLGEGGKPEVVLPLTNAGRMAQLLGDPRVGGPILAAMGIYQSAGGRVVNITHTSIPAATAAAASVTTSTPVEDDQDAVMANMFRRGAISLAEYRSFLEGKRAALQQYSPAEQRYFDMLQDLTDEETRNREQFARDEADRVAEEKRLHDEELEHERQVMAAKFELGEIDATAYESYLAQRMGAFTKYSSEWMSAWSTIQQMHRDAERAQQDQMESMAKVTDAAFRAAAARKELLDATEAASDAESAYAKAKPADRPGAAADLAAAIARQRDADANARGLDDGSREWAMDMRASLEDAKVWYAALGRGDVVSALDRLLEGIPSFASGGYMPATPGGRIVRVAEGGEGEWMVPDSKMVSAGSMAGTTTVVRHTTVRFEGLVTDPPAVAREIREILAEDDRRNGRR